MQPNIIKKSSVRVEDAKGDLPRSTPGGTRRHSGAGRGKKGARLLSKDGAVYAIEVTCGCGDKTVVELQYEQQPVDSGEPESPTS